VRLSTKLSGIVAVGGVAALGAGLISSGGIGATWYDSHVASATINTGDLACALSSPTDRLQESIEQETPNGGTATITLDPITRSEAGIRTAPLTVTNTGTVPVSVTWTKTDAGTLFSDGIPFYSYTIAGEALAPNAKQSANIGFHWDSLDNDAQGKSATVTYNVTCNETPTAPNNLTPFYRYGGSAYYDGTSIQLVTGPNTPEDQVSTAGVYFDGISAGSALPTDEPHFIGTPADGSWPRMQIRLSDGTVLTKSQSATQWSGSNKDSAAGAWFASTGGKWSVIELYVNNPDNKITVQRVYIQAQNPGFTGSISCIGYNDSVHPVSFGC
jgi:hypothetical protein